ncbi:hypothetical protein PVAND_001488 [Polypedilum vanderplanki]|uniref:Aminopeptidase n=1 Tax=Polypedilum vanderplanki TaxID=319348 RepID=A0A9J6BPE3_POLVA|nr:hypothetical protein PVAND_001488 [Polypedilum vanderplanki]
MWKLSVSSVLFVCFALSFEIDVNHRLPNNTSPQAYDINLEFGEFDSGELSFTGSVYITINVSESTNIITLHSSVLVLNTSLTRLNYGGNDIAHTHDVDIEREFLIITTMEEQLQRFSIVLLRVDYSGAISTSAIEGVFRRSYFDKNDKISYYIATQTKPNYARRIFPAYDEPRFKARFQITLSYNAKYKALSNMRERFFIDTNTGRRVSIFNSPNHLPTYLIAFIISEFDMMANITVTTTTTVNNVALRIFAASSQQTENAAFAMETTRQALELFENEFSYAFQYEIDKLDQVALPHFADAACSMVNYGLSFYREDCLLYEPLVNTVSEKQRAERAIINNVCHQLIDLKMSSDYSIASGLCKFYEYHISAKLHPPITAATIEGLFTIETMETALVSDITTTRQEQWQQSDDIAYNKSASVFRMLFHSLTESTFTEGLKIFLSQYSLNPTGVTTQRNLYDAWQRAVNIEQQKKDMENYKVEELFGCWEQVGYPILYVERSYNDHRVRFSQKSIIKDDNTTFWHIPVTYITNDNSTSIRKFWLHPTRQFEMLIDDLRPNSHLLVNVNRMGYYRVQYDEANWMLIARELSHLESSNLSPISRAMLMNDAAIFLANNMLRARIFLELIKHLEGDVEYLPWLVATNNLQHMRWMVVDGNTKMSDDFKRFLQKLLTKVFSTYGIDEQDDEENHHKLMRNIVIEWSCGVHLQSCLDVTRDKLWSYFLDEESPSLSIDHEDIIFCHGLIMATKYEFDFIWKVFKRTTSSSRRLFYLRAMGCIEDDEILMKFIMAIIESDDLTADEIVTILKATYSHNHVGLRVTLQFLRSYYDAVIGLLQKHNIMSAMNQVFHDIALKVNDEILFATLSDILVIYDIDKITQNEIHTIIKENLRFIERHKSDIEDFLEDFHSNASLVVSSIYCILIAVFLMLN